MNFVNSLKTLLLGSGLLVIVGPFVVNLFMKMFGCSGDDPLTKDVVEVAMCTGGSLFAIPAGLQTFVGGLAVSGALALTAWFKGGTVIQNLFNKSVPVVADDKAKAGVVIESQVAAAGAKK